MIPKEKMIHWRRLTGHRVKIPIDEEIKRAIIQEYTSGFSLKACIGTDSQVKGADIEFATVIVLLRKGRGGFMYIHNETIRRGIGIRERMLYEVARSVEIAYGLCDIFNEYNIPMEVHADINTNPSFKSNIALKEAMGYITGMGFSFKAKPEAFASTSCANKIIH